MDTTKRNLDFQFVILRMLISVDYKSNYDQLFVV